MAVHHGYTQGQITEYFQPYNGYQPYQPRLSHQPYQSYQAHHVYHSKAPSTSSEYKAYRPVQLVDVPSQNVRKSNPELRAIHTQQPYQHHQSQQQPHQQQRQPQQPQRPQQKPVRYIPFQYPVTSVVRQPDASSLPQRNPQKAPTPPPKKKPSPPRLAPLIIPVRSSPPPIHLRPEPPTRVPEVKAQPILAQPVPRRPPPIPAKIPLAVKNDEMDYFQFQYPCMLPPSTIPSPEEPPTRSGQDSMTTTPDQYVVPSQLPPTQPLQRPKPYLSTRRQRISSQRSISSTSTASTNPTSTEEEEEEWLNISPTKTPVVGLARPETPLEYRVEQAAALHELLGLVLDGVPVKEEEEPYDGVAVLQEEVELAAKGFGKFSAEEYMRALRDLGDEWTD